MPGPPRRLLSGYQLEHAIADRLADLGHPSDNADATMPQQPGLGSHQQPSLPLVHMWEHTPNFAESWSRVSSGMRGFVWIKVGGE